jgi:hypothetical protein
MTDDFWSWVRFAGTALGAAGSGVAAAIKWFGRREAAMEANIAEEKRERQAEVHEVKTKVNRMSNDIAANALAIAVIQAQNGATTERLTKIEHSIDRINDKQDQQTELLIKIYKEKT